MSYDKPILGPKGYQSAGPAFFFLLEFQQNNFTDLNEIILHSYKLHSPLVCSTLEEFQE